jgi:cell division protein FtsB
MSNESNENRQQAASLGCGTLILIALIVIFFSGGDTTQLTNEVSALRQEVEALRAEQAETHRLIEALVLNAGVDPTGRQQAIDRFTPDPPDP